MTRSALSVTLLCFLCVSAACGGDDTSADDAAVSQDLSASGDQSVAADLAHVGIDLRGVDFAGVSCGAQTCGAGTTCCLMPGAGGAAPMCVEGMSCGDGGVPASCDGPEDCSGSTPFCCANLASASDSIASGSASCTASCDGAGAKVSGGYTIDTRLCHGAADCTGYTGTLSPLGTRPFDRCCGYGNLSLKFCAPAIVTGFSNTITCD